MARISLPQDGLDHDGHSISAVLKFSFIRPRRKNPRKIPFPLSFFVRHTAALPSPSPADAVPSKLRSFEHDEDVSCTDLEVTSVMESVETADAVDSEELLSSAPTSAGPSTPSDSIGTVFAPLPVQGIFLPESPSTDAAEPPALDSLAIPPPVPTAQGDNTSSIPEPSEHPEVRLLEPISRPKTPLPSPAFLLEAEESHISVYDRDSAVEETSSDEDETEMPSMSGREELTREELYAIALEGLRCVGSPRDTEQVEAPYSFTLAGDEMENPLTIAAIKAQFARGRAYRREYLFYELHRRACPCGQSDWPEIRKNGEDEEPELDGETGGGEEAGQREEELEADADEEAEEATVSEGEVEEGDADGDGDDEDDGREEEEDEDEDEDDTPRAGEGIHLPGEYPEETSSNGATSILNDPAVTSDEQSADPTISRPSSQQSRLLSTLPKLSTRPPLGRAEIHRSGSHVRFANEAEAGPSAASSPSLDQESLSYAVSARIPNPPKPTLPSSTGPLAPHPHAPARTALSPQWFFFAKDSLGFEWWFMLDLDCRLHWAFSFLTHFDGADGSGSEGGGERRMFLPKEDFREVEGAVRRSWARRDGGPVYRGAAHGKLVKKVVAT